MVPWTKIWIVTILELLIQLLLFGVYYYQRKKLSQKKNNLADILYCGINISGAYMFMNLGFTGDWRFCHVCGQYHSYAGLCAIIYLCLVIITIVYFGISNTENKRKYIWSFFTICLVMFLSNYLLGQYFFWHVYGPLDVHGGIHYP